MGTYYYHTNNKDYQLAHSHYSDPAFKKEAVIFGKKEDGIRWEYADRLRQWEPEKADTAWKAAVAECGTKNTARRIERYLQLYFDNKSIEIVCILSGTQPFNGYPWYAYGFKDTPTPADEAA